MLQYYAASGSLLQERADAGATGARLEPQRFRGSMRNSFGKTTELETAEWQAKNITTRSRRAMHGGLNTNTGRRQTRRSRASRKVLRAGLTARRAGAVAMPRRSRSRTEIVAAIFTGDVMMMSPRDGGLSPVYVPLSIAAGYGSTGANSPDTFCIRRLDEHGRFKRQSLVAVARVCDRAA